MESVFIQLIKINYWKLITEFFFICIQRKLNLNFTKGEKIRCFGIMGSHVKFAFHLVVKLSVELGYIFLSLRL
jgi:hypothetical protein